MKIVVCDNCRTEIEDENYATVGVPYEAEEDGPQIMFLDLCSKECMAKVFFDGPATEVPTEGEVYETKPEFEVVPVEEEAAPEPEEEPQRLVAVPATRQLTMDERMENEKKYKQQAAELSSGMFQVRNRTLGER